MGGKSSTQQTQTQTATPYGPAQGLLNNLLTKTGGISSDLTGAEQGAFSELSSNAAGGNPFSSQITGVANTLLGGGPDRTGMVNDAYSSYRSALDPTARGDYLDPNKNPYFGTTTGGITDDVMGRLRNEFAAAGRDPTGAGSYGGVVGSEVAKALAPSFANTYNTERQNQLNAIQGLYGAGGQTAGLLSGLDQTKLGNQQAGIQAADYATQAQNYGPLQTLQIEAQKRGIPLQTLAAQMGMTLPAAQAFGTTTGTATGESNMSPVDQFFKISTGLGSLFGGGKKV